MVLPAAVLLSMGCTLCGHCVQPELSAVLVDEFGTAGGPSPRARRPPRRTAGSGVCEAFAGDTVITSSDGVLLADVGNHGDHRLAVKLAQVAPVMVQATVAIEDKGFYSNPGFDAAAIIRAAYDNLRSGHIVGGASTITQQLAKQQFLTPDQTISRKIKELALAYELAQTYSKDQIIELYLNKSFYASQSYGVEAAAESYFHIPASKLDLAQSAVLAGLPQAPTERNPVLHPAAAKLRQTEVLQAMVRSDFISQEDMDKAVAEQLVYQAPINSFVAPHI